MFLNITYESCCSMPSNDNMLMHYKSTYTDYQSSTAVLCMVGSIGLGALAFNGARKTYKTVVDFNKESKFLPQIFGENTNTWQKAKKIALFIAEVFAGIILISTAWFTNGLSLLVTVVALSTGLLVIHGIKTILNIYNKIIGSREAP
ncbi:MAG: hypothetical protein SP4CHLAM5_02230 [Chlamydiia bacterium]|nr:hypothetical protein [Chlamydiia bacterium]MCH9618097.1 hypothetical protein [Chlamydiia bacterium]MCH9623977.1 hypothetical protein [Chlamydiia bacterium]